jgi:hypothetical protein
VSADHYAAHVHEDRDRLRDDAQVKQHDDEIGRFIREQVGRIWRQRGEGSVVKDDRGGRGEKYYVSLKRQKS